MNEIVPIGRRLAALRDRTGLSVRDVARALGYAETQSSTYASYERETYKQPLIPMKLARKLVPVLSGHGSPPVTEAEVLLLAGVEESRAPRPAAEGEVSPPPGSLMVNEYDVSAAAGDGTLPVLNGNDEARILAEWVVPRDFLPAQYRSARIAIVRVQGDSMAPEIMPEERVMVDTAQTFVGPEVIYLIWDGGGLLVKRVQKVPGRKLRIVSRNPAYDPYEQPADEVQVLGRVIGRWEWK